MTVTGSLSRREIILATETNKNVLGNEFQEVRGGGWRDRRWHSFMGPGKPDHNAKQIRMVGSGDALGSRTSVTLGTEPRFQLRDI